MKLICQLLVFLLLVLPCLNKQLSAAIILEIATTVNNSTFPGISPGQNFNLQVTTSGNPLHTTELPNSLGWVSSQVPFAASITMPGYNSSNNYLIIGTGSDKFRFQFSGGTLNNVDINFISFVVTDASVTSVVGTTLDNLLAAGTRTTPTSITANTADGAGLTVYDVSSNLAFTADITSYTVTNLSAVPDPSSIALLALVSVPVVFRKRVRKLFAIRQP